MLKHQPGNLFSLFFCETKAGAELQGDLGTSRRVALGASFGNVMQENGHIEYNAVLDIEHEIMRQRMLVAQLLLFDL